MTVINQLLFLTINRP